jgi:hypothetical protein
LVDNVAGIVAQSIGQHVIWRYQLARVVGLDLLVQPIQEHWGGHRIQFDQLRL